MEILNSAPDPRVNAVKSIIIAALSSTNVIPEPEQSGYYLELTHRNLGLKLNIPGLSEVAWTSLMFEASGALEEFLGGACTLNIMPVTSDSEWSWEEASGLKIGVISTQGPLATKGLRTKALIFGAFAFKKTEIELFEYFISFAGETYQASIIEEDGCMKIEMGSEASSELKLSVNLGEISISLEDLAKLRAGAAVKFSRPETHNVLLSVNGSPYAVGEATWGTEGVEIKVIEVCQGI